MRRTKTRKRGGMRRLDTFLVLLLLLVLSFVWARCTGDDSLLRVISGQKQNGQGSALTHAIPKALVIPEQGESIRFMMYNVENYFVAGEKSRSKYVQKLKSEQARNAVAEVIASEKPAVLGLIEIGGPLALLDLKQRLLKVGVDYPYYRVLARHGDDRALGLLSMFPIAQDHSQAHYRLYGEQRRFMLRGILDVTVQLPDERFFRIVGAHLKSRVSDDPAAAASLRAREARTLAMYLRDAMQLHPKMPILVFGDWNDGPSDASLGVLTQGISAASALTRLNPVDSRSEGWTLHYKAGNEYCVFDQIYLNSVLLRRLKKNEKSGVVDIPASKKASDHRAVWCEIR